MDQVVNPPPAETLAALQDRHRSALFDVLFLLVSLWAYVVSLFAPMVGIVLGITFLNWGGTEETRKLGRVCLILGIINVILYIILFTGIVAVGGLASRFSPYNWEGL